MSFLKVKFIVDGRGRKKNITLDIKDYELLREEQEEREAIRVFDQIKSAKDEVLPFEQPVREIKSTSAIQNY